MRVAVIGNPSPAALVVAGLAPTTAGGYEYEARRDIVYGVVDGHELVLDLYVPKGAEGLRPGLVFVHGGGWSGGERQGFEWHAEQTAAMGYVVINIDYRLTGTALYPACVDDCQRAVRWLRKRAGDLQLDPDRIGAFGSSAGGHLAAYLGTRDTRDDSVAELRGISSRVQCVVDYHGIHDLPGVVGRHQFADSCTRFIGGTFAEKPEAWRDASPLTFVDGRSAAMLLFHDPDDPTVPYRQSVRFATALMAAGRPVWFCPVPGAGHGFGYSPANAWQQRTWPLAVVWLARFLKP